MDVGVPLEASPPYTGQVEAEPLDREGASYAGGAPGTDVNTDRSDNTAYLPDNTLVSQQIRIGPDRQGAIVRRVTRLAVVLPRHGRVAQASSVLEACRSSKAGACLVTGGLLVVSPLLTGANQPVGVKLS